MVYELYPHQQEIIDAVKKEFDSGNKRVLIVSPAGSGKSIMIAAITKDKTDKGSRVLFMVHRKELLDQIENSLRNNDVNMDLVDILSAIKTKNRLKKLKPPDLIITDEAHHSKAKTYLSTYKYFPDVPRLGFTATPIRLSGEGFDDVYDVMVEGKSVSWLIEHNYLAPYTYYSLPVIDRKKLKKHSGEYTNASIDAALAGSTIFGDIVNTYQSKAAGTQAILYAHSVEYSKRYAAQFKAAGINAVHVDSNTPQNERDEIMAGFKKGEYQIICNVDLISEGFDVPDCSTIILLRPTQSLTVFVQQSMRGMRYKPGKSSIIIDHVGNYIKHGLPDSERLWSLVSDKEPKEPKTKHCPVCKAIFANWKTKTKNGDHFEVCPNCGHEFEIIKEPSEEEKNQEKTVESNRKLEQIGLDDLGYLEMKRISKEDAGKYSSSLFKIAMIFVYQNKVALMEKHVPRVKKPLLFAIRQYFNFNHINSIKDLDNAKFQFELKTICDKWGKEYHATPSSLMSYCNWLLRK